MALSRRELERLSYRPKNELAPETVGALLALIYISRRDQALPNRLDLTRLFQKQRDVPARLKVVAELVDRFDGPMLATYTEMVDFAQQAGVLKRFNPAHINNAAGVGPLEARHLLQMAGGDFGEEIKWLNAMLDSEDAECAAATA